MTAIKLPARATAEYPKQIAKLDRQFTREAETIEEKIISAANIARHIGILFTEWIGHQQVKFEFFNAWHRDNAAKMPKGYTPQRVKNFMRIAAKLPEAVKDFATAKDALQLTFLAAGMIEQEGRAEQQQASPITALTFFMDKMGSAKERLEKWIEDEPVAGWPAARRADVRSELKWAHDLYERLGR